MSHHLKEFGRKDCMSRNSERSRVSTNSSYKKPIKINKSNKINDPRLKIPNPDKNPSEKTLTEKLMAELVRRDLQEMLYFNQQMSHRIEMMHALNWHDEVPLSDEQQLLMLIEQFDQTPTLDIKKQILSFSCDSRILNHIRIFAGKHGTIEDFVFLAAVRGGAEAMYTCCSQDRHDVFDFMLDRGVPLTNHYLVNAKGTVRNTMLNMGMSDPISFQNACKNGDEEEFHKLILNGVDINEPPWFSITTPLQVALDNDQHAIVDTLRALGARV